MTNLQMKFLWIHSDHPETEVHPDEEGNPDVEENRDLQGDLECPGFLEIQDLLDPNLMYNRLLTKFNHPKGVKKDHRQIHFRSCRLKLGLWGQEVLRVCNKQNNVELAPGEHYFS